MEFEEQPGQSMPSGRRPLGLMRKLASGAIKALASGADPIDETTPLAMGARAQPSASHTDLSARGEAEDVVRRLFRAVLQRDPEPSALEAFASALTAGALSPVSMAEELLRSKEFGERALLNPMVMRHLASAHEAGTAPARAVAEAITRRLFHALFLREPDAAGLDAYADGLVHGALTEGSMIEDLLRTEEFRRRLAVDPAPPDSPERAIREALAGSKLYLGSIDHFWSPLPIAVFVRLMQPQPDGFRQIDLRIGHLFGERPVEPAAVARIAYTVRALAPFLAELPSKGCVFPLDCSDEGSASCVSMDRPIGTNWSLIPDIYALDMAMTPSATPAREEFAAQFVAKRAALFWRGSTTGDRISSPDDMLANQRVKACHLCRVELAEVSDCRLTDIVQVDEDVLPALTRRLTELDLLAARVPEAEFSRWRLCLDIEGNTSAWGSLRNYLSGAAVVRAAGRRETAFTRGLKPWEHFIPVDEDLSNLAQRTRDALAASELTEEIAWKGHLAALQFKQTITSQIDRCLASPLVADLALSSPW